MKIEPNNPNVRFVRFDLRPSDNISRGSWDCKVWLSFEIAESRDAGPQRDFNARVSERNNNCHF